LSSPQPCIQRPRIDTYASSSPSDAAQQNLSVALKARSSPKVVEIFKVLHDVPSEDDLVMQLQGLFWGFPPEHYPGGFIPPQEGAPSNQGGYYHWSEMWMHSDRGRSTTYPAPLQCTLVLEDVSLYDHGFVFLSKSHYYHDEFFASHPPGTLELEPRSLLPPTTPVAAGSAAMRQQQQQQQQQQQLLQEEGKDTYIQLTYENVKYFEQKGCQWKKVVAPKGSIIIWDSRLIHSTCAPSRGRPFPRARFIVFGGYVPRADLTEEEKAERARNFQRYCQGIDHQILLELWQRGPPGRLRRLMGLEEPGGEGSVGGLTSVGSGMSGGSAEEGEEEGEQERKKEGCGGVTEERKLIGGRIHHQEEGERKEEQQKMAMIKLKGLEGAWSWKEKEAANALLVMMRPNKQKR